MQRPRTAAIGDVLAHKYILRALLGDGGMGVVFCAEQPTLERTVAIKLLHRELVADPTIVRRFRDEARAASQLHHPNVVAVIDFGETDDGTPFLVMEHVRGTSLTRIVQATGPLAIRRAAGLVRQILAALDEAHGARVVHGDVKCDNVLVEQLHDGVELVKMVDFGLARCGSDATLSAADGAMVVAGTPEYMAPELIAGGGVTVATDLYATGVILYELVTGSTPFAGGAAGAIMTRHQRDAVVPPSLRRPDRVVAIELERVMMRALAKDPTERYPSASAFATALTAATPAFEPAPDR
ncbi:MAG: serine/threonine protein kinase, partial [Deltaproteobacteria bacterium]|nr:serine/threonine protein kinase [Deltaproteobacteria bacterium]